MAQAKKKVLITGLSGLIGGAAYKELADTYDVSGLNRSEVAGIPCHRADIADLDAIRPAFEGVDTVVHLAAYAHLTTDWDTIVNANITGTYNVFEAAREAGVKRVVYASTGATTSSYEFDEPHSGLVDGRYTDEALDSVSWPMITHESAVRPNGLYGASKVFGEALARHYADTTDMSMICLRIGRVNEEDRPVNNRDMSVWCSQADIVRMIALSVAAPDDLKFDIFYVVSDNKRNYRDLSHAREVLGFVPQDSADRVSQ
ncbi:MAG: NAD(P)-dependent oxidoreductase [Chloroflexota bacterium]